MSSQISPRRGSSSDLTLSLRPGDHGYQEWLEVKQTYRDRLNAYRSPPVTIATIAQRRSTARDTPPTAQDIPRNDPGLTTPPQPQQPAQGVSNEQGSPMPPLNNNSGPRMTGKPQSFVGRTGQLPKSILDIYGPSLLPVTQTNSLRTAGSTTGRDQLQEGQQDGSSQQQQN